MSSFRLVLTLHLFAGLTLAAYLFMYAFSGFVMLHSSWFPGNTDVVTTHGLSSTLTVRMPTEMTDEQAWEWGGLLAEELDLQGRQIKPKRGEDASWLFNYERPRAHEKLRVEAGEPAVSLEISERGFASTLNRLHQLKGYSGGPRFFVWALFIDLVSVALIVFPLSGIYLWYVIKRDHRLGWLILGTSTAYVVGSLAFLVLRR